MKAMRATAIVLAAMTLLSVNAYAHYSCSTSSHKDGAHVNEFSVGKNYVEFTFCNHKFMAAKPGDDLRSAKAYVYTKLPKKVRMVLYRYNGKKWVIEKNEVKTLKKGCVLIPNVKVKKGYKLYNINYTKGVTYKSLKSKTKYRFAVRNLNGKKLSNFKTFDFKTK